MSVVTDLLEGVSADSPCGANLEYDPAFLELETVSAGKPERRIGDSVIAAEEPDWRDVRRRAGELLGRSKDLRVAVTLTRALARLDGMTGLHEGLGLIAGLLDRYWDHVHPQLDPDDGNDPTLRVNALAGLADWDGLIQPLRALPLVQSRVAGRFGLRDIELANGTATLAAEDDSPVPESSVIDAAFLDADLAELQATAAGVHGALGEAQRIAATVTERVGASRSIDLSRLVGALKSADSILAQQLARRGAGGEETPAGTVAGNGPAAGAARPIPGEVASREDVIRLLDKACEYFKKHEPSSPVPLLLQRAKRLVSKDFLEIIKDLAPGGVSEVRSLGGLDNEEG